MKNKFVITRTYYDRVTRELTNKILEQKRRIEYLENLHGAMKEIARSTKIRAHDTYEAAYNWLDSLKDMIDVTLAELEGAYND